MVNNIKLLITGFLLFLGFMPAAAQHKGKASYYSRKATGARAASGERLHHDSLTCAHRTYPFGTLLKVTNLSNKKSVIVRVNDRGPFGRGRIIDLSYGAARELGMLSQGVAMVQVEKVDAFRVPYRLEDKPEVGMPDFEFPFSELTTRELIGKLEPEKKPDQKQVQKTGQKSVRRTPPKTTARIEQTTARKTTPRAMAKVDPKTTAKVAPKTTEKAGVHQDDDDQSPLARFGSFLERMLKGQQ